MKEIPAFSLPYDISAMGEPTVEALDANFDYLGDYMKTHVFPALISQARELEDLRKRIAMVPKARQVGREYSRAKPKKKR